jgi:hypothetical protein
MVGRYNRCDKVLIVTTNYHGYDNYRCDKVLIVTTNYHGYDNYRCDKVLIVTYFITSMVVAVIVGSYNHFSITSIVVIAVIVAAMTTVDVIQY